MVATNAGGIEAFRNGVMRHLILGLEVVLADGSVISDLKKVTKANEGYDVKQLFIGSEGTLGMITKISLSLVPLQEPSNTALISCLSASKAISLFRHLRNHRNLTLLSIEAMWPDYIHTVAKAVSLTNLLKFEQDPDAIYVLVDFCESQKQTDNTLSYFESTLVDLIESEIVTNAIISKNQKERDDMWRIREDSFAVDDLYPHGFWFDMSVPLENLAAYADGLEKRLQRIHGDIRLFLFAYLGDGNFHATITTGYPMLELKDDIHAAVYDGLAEWGGSFSAEHGIGTDKRESLNAYVPEVNRQLMETIKRALDPKNIMNPGKVL